LEVRLLISENGQAEVISTNVVQGNGNFAADQFVRGMIQDWKFNPAISEGQPVQSLLDVSIRVSPLSR
jgi:outer membrane biosynthesis protein TonB